MHKSACDTAAAARAHVACWTLIYFDLTQFPTGLGWAGLGWAGLGCLAIPQSAHNGDCGAYLLSAVQCAAVPVCHHGVIAVLSSGPRTN